MRKQVVVVVVVVVVAVVAVVVKKEKRKKGRKKGKAIPLQSWTGLEGYRRLRLPDFKRIGT